MSLGENLKRIRKERKMSREKLGSLIGKSQHSIKKYELGEVVPSLKIINDLADALDIPPGYLIKEAETDQKVDALYFFIDGTDFGFIKWKKVNLELEGSIEDEKVVDNRGVDLRKIFFQLFEELESGKEEHESFFYFSKWEDKQFYLLKIKNKEKYILFSSQLDDKNPNSFLIMSETSEDYPEIKNLYERAKLSSEGKHVVYDYFEHKKKIEKEE